MLLFQRHLAHPIRYVRIFKLELNISILLTQARIQALKTECMQLYSVEFNVVTLNWNLNELKFTVLDSKLFYLR